MQGQKPTQSLTICCLCFPAICYLLIIEFLFVHDMSVDKCACVCCVVFVRVFMCVCSTDTCWNSLLIIKSFSRQLLEPKWVLGFDLVYKEWRSIIIWRRIVEEEACREEGTDFSKGRYEAWKTKKTSFHLDQSSHIRLKCQTCEADAWCLST